MEKKRDFQLRVHSTARKYWPWIKLLSFQIPFLPLQNEYSKALDGQRGAHRSYFHELKLDTEGSSVV